MRYKSVEKAIYIKRENAPFLGCVYNYFMYRGYEYRVLYEPGSYYAGINAVKQHKRKQKEIDIIIKNKAA